MVVTYTIDDLAQRLRCSRKTVYTRLPKMEQAGFPRRLPGCGALWSAAAVDAWINNAAPAAPPGAPAACDPVSAAAAELEAVYAPRKAAA